MKDSIIITIGRQFGSGGLEVARHLSRKLDIPVYDRELISKAAHDSGISAEMFEEKDEKRGFSLKGMLLQSFGAEYDVMSEANIFRLQSEAIIDIASKGSAIIVGRCSNYILREMQTTFNVFLTAPMEERIKRISERMKVNAEEAEAIIEKKDRKRSEYYNYFTFGEWGMASEYDLCMDSSILGTEGTADMIIEAARKAGRLTR
ncbi:MAG: cytidylate kinase-like family protein [Bacteroidales bacterium]|nr:cytidylate kinase-like family protein [Bacteroidales bacterium]